MTIAKRVALALQQIDAQLALAEKKLGDENNLVRLAAKYDAQDALDTAMTGVPHGNEVQTDLRAFATFIAASRAGWPTALRCVRTAIEGLLWIHQSPFLDSTESGEIAQGDADNALVTICDQLGVPK